ncbi:MAG: hypothetical protein WCK03_04605 [Candidatus Taylorbacteria bacterium]
MKFTRFKIPINKDFVKAKELSANTKDAVAAQKQVHDKARSDAHKALGNFERSRKEVHKRTPPPYYEQLNRIQDRGYIRPAFTVQFISDSVFEYSEEIGVSAEGDSVDAPLSNGPVAEQKKYRLAKIRAGIVRKANAVNGYVAHSIGAATEYLNRRKEIKKINRVSQAAGQAKEYIEELNNTITELSKIESAAVELQQLILKTEKKYLSHLRLVTYITNHPTRTVNLSTQDRKTVETFVSMGQILDRILALDIINDEGALSDDALKLISSGK